jgi:DtxR family Mn-dependent transcriptional regulator
MFTLSEENYLKAIYHLESHLGVSVSTNAIAEKIKTKASSVTDMIKKLAEKGLVSYKRYKGVNLTDKGRSSAISVIRKHRLWEVFLVEKLNFSWDEVHEVAEQLEHIKSEKLTQQLDAFLGFPERDPHGDPIPDKDGNFSTSNKILLNEASIGTDYKCFGVKDSSANFLKYLNKYNLTLGTELRVISKEDFDESMTIRFNNIRLNVSKAIANNLYIKPI